MIHLILCQYVYRIYKSWYTYYICLPPLFQLELTLHHLAPTEAPEVDELRPEHVYQIMKCHDLWEDAEMESVLLYLAHGYSLDLDPDWGTIASFMPPDGLYAR